MLLKQNDSSGLPANGFAMPVSLHVNGKHYRLQLDPRTSLLDALREHIGLTGSKKGCNQGACGACTVLANVPKIEIIYTDIPDERTPLGAHGIGGIGITGAAAAIANAVFNATGNRVRSLPITLDKLLS